jgi:hypothetical protein
MKLRILPITMMLLVGLQWAQAGAGQAAEPPTRIGPEAVWNPGQTVVSEVREGCIKPSEPELGKCFVEGMKKAGASAEAVAFMHSLNNDAYLIRFVRAGGPDIAFVRFPFRANQNDGCLLVNGNPALMNVDDLRKLPQSEMKKDPAYATLLAEYPKAMLWPGDRGDVNTVKIALTKASARSFLVSYMLLNGCHACARLATVWFRFDFDSTGKYVGTRYQKLERLPPVQ